MKMTIKDAILKSLDDLIEPANYFEIYNHIIKNNYCEFTGLTPTASVSGYLSDFIKFEDTRVKRIKLRSGYAYYLTKNEEKLNLEVLDEVAFDVKSESKVKSKNYLERDLHILLSTYLNESHIYSKTIFHEKSKNGADSYQKWTHPDMVGVKFLKLKNESSQIFLKSSEIRASFKLYSYEIKKEITSDNDLKSAFFQAVSNSSWAHFGYLVAFEFSGSVLEELERLSQAFGIGVIKLNANPFVSSIILPAKQKDLDYKTIDKLCIISPEFENFIKKIEKLIVANEKYIEATENELKNFCDLFLKDENEINEYLKEKNIPTDLQKNSIIN